MKSLLSFLAALVLSVSLHAQQFDNPTTIPVSYYGYSVVAGSTASFSFGAELGSVTSASGSGGGTSFYSPLRTVNLIPGKEYNVSVTSSGAAVVVVRFAPISGCEVFINQSKTTSFSQGTNYTFKVRIEKINDLTQGLASTRGGQASSFTEDKPIWYVGLGTLRNGKFAGAVGFRAAAITPALWSNASLIYDSVDTSEVSVTRNGSGHIINIQSREVVLNVTNVTGTSYDIQVCQPATPTTPFIVYTVKQYNAGGVNGIRIDKVENGITWSTVLFESGGNWTLYDWQKVASSGTSLVASNAVTTSVNGSTKTVNYGSGAGMMVKQKTYVTVSGAQELASLTLGPGVTSAPLTSYSYYASSTGNGWNKAVQAIVQPTGNWVKFDYFNGVNDTRAGQIRRIYRPWLDSPGTWGTATTTNCYLETYDYSANYDGSLTAPQYREVRINNSLAGRTEWTYNWSYATVNSQTIAQIIQQEAHASGSYLTTTTRSYRPDNPNTFYRGRPHAIIRPDGTKDAYAYYFGSWNSSTNTFTFGAGNDRMVLALHGQAASGTATTAVSSWNSWTIDTVYMVAQLSTISQTVTDTNGRIIFTGENIYTGGSGMELIAGTASTFNGNNHRSLDKDVIRSVATAGGDVAVTYGHSAGLLTSKTDVDGTQTTWGYNDLLQNTTQTTATGGTGNYPAKTQTFTYYNSNLRYSSQDCSCSPVVTTYTYETSGRIASMSNPKPGGGTLTTVYTYPSLVQSTVTMPTLATKTTTQYLDGKLKSQTGDGQVNSSIDYSYNGTHFLKTRKVGSTTANGWLEEKSDWLGRPITERAPEVTWASGSNKIVRKTYTYSGTTGQLTSLSTVDEAASSARILPDRFYVYGDLGRLVKEGDDVDASGSLSDASTDRITTYSANFWKDTGGYNGWIRDDITQVLRTRNNGIDTATISWTRTRFTRFNNGTMLGGTDRVLSDKVEIDPSGQATSNIMWSNFSARTRTQSVSEQGAGQVAISVWQDGYLQSEQSISGVTKTYTYDGLGLIASVTESTTNAATSYNYYAGTPFLLSTVQTIGASTSATTAYAYSWDTAAKSSTVRTTDGANNVAYEEYNSLGLPWRTWGTAAQPSLNSYDAYGRLISRRTWQSGSFTAATWPSPSGGNLVTWNLDAATGAVTSKVYPNSSSVGFTYNARGQVKTRTWARGVVTTYDYWEGGGGNDLTGELRQVTYSDGTPTYSVSRSRVGAPWGVTDAAGNRVVSYRSDLQLDHESLGTFYGSRTLTASYDSYGRTTGYSFNGSATVSATIGYDGSSGRPNSVAGALGATTATFLLGYASGTDWVNSVTSGSYSRSTPLVSRCNVLASATTTWSGTQLGNFTANYTDVRGWRNGQNTGSSGGTPAGSWSKVLNLGDGLQSSYSYNGYGELTTAPTPNWQNTSGSQSLSARSFGWTYDLSGNRASETGAAATTYLADALNRYTSITGILAEPGLSYDADGNLTQDGTWTYAYDGENRLKGLTKSGQTLTFAYDYLGRRIRKTVTGTGASDTKFLWAGWKLAAELSADGVTVNKTFIWGQDFSDAQGAAGGAGSLLAQITGSAVTYAMPDAPGNIVGYVNTSGTIVAAAEYSPYGRLINSYGSISSYPIGYSGQYTDSETGLVYYGLRYYAPKHGRFINRDPIEEAGGNNLYGFVGNRPTRGWDVLGLDAVTEAAARQRWGETWWSFILAMRESSYRAPATFGQGWDDNFWVTAYNFGPEYNAIADRMGIGSIPDPRTGQNITAGMAAGHLYSAPGGGFVYADAFTGRMTSFTPNTGALANGADNKTGVGTSYLFEKGKRYLNVYDGKELDKGKVGYYRIEDRKSASERSKLTGWKLDLYDVANPDNSKLSGKYDGIVFSQHGDMDNQTGFWRPKVANAFVKLAPELQPFLGDSGWVAWDHCFGGANKHYLDSMKSAMKVEHIRVSSGPETGFKTYDGPFVFLGGTWIEK